MQAHRNESSKHADADADADGAPVARAPALRRASRNWGGRRTGAGRPKKTDAGVSHRARQQIAPETPVHVTMRVRPGLRSLRTLRVFRRIRRAFEDGHARFGFRLVHYSVQGNHLHLIAEAETQRALSRGIQGLAVRLAKGVNAVLRRSGPVFEDRFHTSVLESSFAAHRALRYVLNNRRKHLAQIGERLPRRWLDPYSSAAWFSGWSPPSAVRSLIRSRLFRQLHTSPATHLAPPESDFLTHRWAQHGLIAPAEVPGPLKGSEERRR